jgi:hypothetical protein
MTGKEKIQKALNHQSVNGVPVDFGSTFVSGIHVQVIEGLKKHYGLGDGPVKVADPGQMLGFIDDDLNGVMGVDTLGVFKKTNRFGVENANWKEYKTPWGQTVLIPGKLNLTTGSSGEVFAYPSNDISVPPSSKMAASSYFFDTIERQEPLDEEKLNPQDNLEEFSLITDEELSYWADEIDKVIGQDKAVVASFGGTALGDIAHIPGPGLRHPRGIRSVEEWYLSIISRPEYIRTVFEKQIEIALDNFKKIYKVVGNHIDVVYMCGCDFGTQNSTFCSLETFEYLWKPFYLKMNNWIHENTGWKTFKHSCGAIEPFINAFSEAGFDIINPVQISAAGMDPKQLKEKYGKKITFWGGGVDTQKILPFGNPEEVREQVLRHIEIFGKDGGYVFNTVHNIQARTPVENVVAMIDALKEVNKN